MMRNIISRNRVERSIKSKNRMMRNIRSRNRVERSIKGRIKVLFVNLLKNLSEYLNIFAEK